ncbi:integrase catalytic domain-containing protein [Trichonephila clavipes]|nr:integrase catalytic domain-containing protein [Trichonephila clavipes]
MYRQILVADEDQKYQQILWRNNSSENIRTYKLKTVTYGLASASFLATRCIKQIALDDKDNPNLSRVLQEDIYMDDLLSGADTPNNAFSICKDIAHVLSTRGFHLRKWNSNSTNFSLNFQNIVLMMHELNFPKILMKVLKTSFTLYSIHEDFYQKLWLTKTDWDSPIPQQLTEDWLRFQKAFNAINYLTVPRWVILTADNIVELHGFADASSLAYAAAIYCRQKHNGKIKVQLLVSKTKVAPVKQVSIPRLELCGAHLLSKLFKSVLRTLEYYTFDVFAWTDSKIVLSWLSGHPRQWKTFVANGTSEIIEVLPTKHWRHVPSKENPADIAFRGIDPKCLPDCKLWWQGPPWLRLETSSWPKAESSCDEASDEIASQGSSISSSHINTTSLTFSETKTAEETIIRWVQGFYFQEEIRSIKKQISLPPKSPLRSLHPFIDEHGLVRVGGRLQNSQLPFNSKHPIILPSQHSISELLIKEQHIAHLHAGPTLLAHVLRQSHWIVGTTKDVHIEAVGDLTTDSFIAALRRFSARRGAPRHIYSDNGTNFVGARRKLDEIRKLWLSLPTNKAISYYLSKSSIDWHFIPPSSPHFGGIWESGIRSVKFHLKRVLGETILTFEELTTLLTQIEGLLNSRPLSYVNDSDIECISTLTPSHFLTGDVLLSVPEELPSTSNHRDRWELLQNIKRGFLEEVEFEFISSLQPRKKWQDAQPNLKEDDIVLIKRRVLLIHGQWFEFFKCIRQRRTGSCCNCENPRLSV